MRRETYITLADVATGIDDAHTVVPAAFSLEPNYPNPFNASTTIRYAVPTPSEIRLTVYDITGSKVAVLDQGLKTAGLHAVTFNADNLSSGLYLYRLETPAGGITKGMFLVK